MNFSELREKEVINICDGRRLGKPSDIGLNENACAVSLVVPGSCGLKGIFHSGGGEIVIAWSRIRRIGDDVILVELPGYETET